MNKVIKILMDREDLTKAEAKDLYQEMKNQIYDILDAGGSYDEVEEYLNGEGFEMDYIFDFVG